MRLNSSWVNVIAFSYFRKNIYQTNGIYYKPISIVNDDSSVIKMLKTSLTDDTRVVIYDRHMSIVQATEHISFYLRYAVPSTG